MSWTCHHRRWSPRRAFSCPSAFEWCSWYCSTRWPKEEADTLWGLQMQYRCVNLQLDKKKRGGTCGQKHDNYYYFIETNISSLQDSLLFAWWINATWHLFCIYLFEWLSSKRLFQSISRSAIKSIQITLSGHWWRGKKKRRLHLIKYHLHLRGRSVQQSSVFTPLGR